MKRWLCLLFILHPSSFLLAEERPATVLLISHDSLAKSWQPFAEWKTRCGKATKIITTHEINKHYKGKDIQQKIRACVLEHTKEHGTQWVILGGDSQPGGRGLVPDRDTPHPILGYKDIPTDLYYISDKDWDADHDGIYGEWKDDRNAIAYTGQACIGRIPVRSVKDVQAYTEKVIAYETKYPEGKFAESFTYICTARPANYKSEMYWDSYLSKAWTHGACDKFFTDKTPWDKDQPGDYHLTPENWVERINSRSFGKLHMHGHGLLHCWKMEGRQVADESTVRELRNENAYLILTTVSCFTGEYDSKTDPCIAETMLRAPKAGAVIVVAPSRPGVPIFHDRFSDPRDGKTQDGTSRTLTMFWMNGLSKDWTAGEAWAKTKEQLTNDARRNAGYHWCQCELNLLGDPTLDLRARSPSTPKVEAPTMLEVGKQNLKIDAKQKGLTVCLWKGEEVYEVAKTDSRGLASFTIKPMTEGTLQLTVSGPSMNTYTADIAVASKSNGKN